MRQAVWVLVGAVSFTAAGVMWARADTTERFEAPAVSAAVSPGASAGAGSAAPVTSDGAAIDRVLEIARTLPSTVGEVRAECLDQQGHPEAKQARDLRRPAAGVQRREPLAIALLDFGPTTRAEARRWGLAGTELAFDEGDTGIVISRDPAYDLAAEHCDGWIYDDLAPGLRQDQSDLAAFVDAVANDFVERVGEAVTPVLAERVRCVARDHPGVTVDDVLAADSMLEILAAAEVEPGARVDPPAGPTEEDVRSGEVGVFAPVPAATYAPSPEEVGFALRYADCATSTHFVERVAAAEEKARDAVRRRHADDAAALVGKLERDSRRLATVVVR